MRDRARDRGGPVAEPVVATEHDELARRERLHADRQPGHARRAPRREVGGGAVGGVRLERDLERVGARGEARGDRGDRGREAVGAPQRRRAAAEVDRHELARIGVARRAQVELDEQRREIVLMQRLPGLDREVAVRTALAAPRKMDVDAYRGTQEMPPIYLDNAASTRVADDVLALMTEVMRTAWGNPSSAHPQGAASRARTSTTARDRMRRGARAATGDVVFTSGCSEANALAVLGAARTHAGRIVISTFEHPAVSTLADRLAAEGREVVQVEPGPDGVIDPDEVARAAEGAGVVSIVMVQNEIGVVQPISAIVAAVRARAPGAHVHLDAAQAFGKIAIDATCGADSIAIAGHKLHAPKGVGALWLRAGVVLEPLWVGGRQQGGLRGGTQDAPSAAALGLAAERAVATLPTARARWLELAARVMAAVAPLGVRQLVPDPRRAPHILALAVPGVPAAALRNVLASRGVYISTGSACADRGRQAVRGARGDRACRRTPAWCGLSFGLDTTRRRGRSPRRRSSPR